MSLRPSAEFGHRGDDRGQHARRGADPPGVGRADDPGARVGQQHGHAVGGEDGDPDPGPRGDDRVGVRVVDRTGVRRRVDRHHAGAVHLLQEHDRHAQLTGQARAVRRDRGGVVTDPRRQVERAVDTP